MHTADSALQVLEYVSGRLVVTYEDSDGNEYVDEWYGTREELHTALAKRGYKRYGPAKGSDIGGVYVRAA